MRWKDLSESSNVDDRRGRGSSSSFPGFRFPSSSSSGSRGRGGIPIRGKSGLVILAVVIIAGYYGIDLTPLITGGASLLPDSMTTTTVGTGQSQTQGRASSASNLSETERQLGKFASVVLRTTEDTWTEIFKASGRTYTPPTMVLYSGTTNTACGYGSAATGPFYCPADNKLYIDLSFYNEMEKKLGGGGDFALGYVLAHEVGHHVQTLLGTTAQVSQAQKSASSQKEANSYSVKLELQADCYAGVWGNRMKNRGLLESGDLEEALKTATAIGDDRLQQQAGGRVVPDSFTHGTSAQRLSWFKTGFESGNPGKCNTFK